MPKVTAEFLFVFSSCRKYTQHRQAKGLAQCLVNTIPCQEYSSSVFMSAIDYNIKTDGEFLQMHLNTYFKGNIHSDGVSCFYNQEAFHCVIY